MVIKLRKSVLKWVKLLTFILVIYALYYRCTKINFVNALDQISLSPIWLVFSFLLVIVNWGLEFIKWELIVKPITKISRYKLFQSMLSGISTGMITPNRIGNFIGRVLYFRPRNRAILIMGTFYGNFSQFLSSILVGAIVFLLFGDLIKSNEPFFIQNTFYYIIGVVFMIFLLGVYFAIVCSTKFTLLFRPFKKLNNLFFQFQKVYKSISLSLLFLSAFRFLVFSFQFLLIFKAFGGGFSVELFYAIILVYFLTTLTPSLFMGKLFIRENYALFVLAPFVENQLIILLASFSIWLINLALPALVGLFYFSKLKNDVD